MEELLLAQARICMDGENTMRKRKLAEEPLIISANCYAVPKHSLKMSRDNGGAGKWREEEVQ